MFERILVALDGSPMAELILPQLARLLEREDSEVILVRTFEPMPPVVGVDRQRSDAADLEAAQTYLHGMVLKLAEGGIKAHARVVMGPAPQAILETADLEGVTLIAMTTHGRTGLARWALGSVAEKVARSSRVPVLLVRSFRRTPKGEWQPVTAAETPFRKILVPVDGSATSLAAVTPAEKLGLLYGSEITLLHVEPPPVVPGPHFAGAGAGPWVHHPPTPSEQDPATIRAAERFGHAGLRTRRLTVGGDAAGEIIDRAEALGVDLIALATHGRSGVARWTLGSVAERVLRHATVPVLIVRGEENAAPIEPQSKPEAHAVN